MTFSATAYALPFRFVTAALLIVSRASLLVLVALAFFVAEPITTGRLLRAFWILVLAPEVAVRILRYLLVARVSVDEGALAVELRTRRVEIPLSAIAAIVPWTLPIPVPGLWLKLRSGSRFSDGLHVEEPAALLQGLRDAGARDLVDRVSHHPTLLYAQSRHRAASRFDRPFFKYVIFALVPTVPLFRLRQLLTYGGTFGEYYDFGLKAYVLGFGIHWVLYGVYLLLYATVLRTITETMALGAAWLVPSYEAGIRQACEIVHRVLYFGGVPTVLLLRFFAS
jgi:apolipoprotein N-acyltransferase